MKTILSNTLCLLLLLTCTLRVQAQVTPALTIGGTDALRANAHDILGDGGSVSYDAASKTLTLCNANVGDIYATLAVETIRISGQCYVTNHIDITEPGGTTVLITGNSPRDRLCFRSPNGYCGISVGSSMDIIDWNHPTYPDLTIANCYIRAANGGSISGRSLLTIKNACVEVSGDYNVHGFSRLVLNEGFHITSPAGTRYDETLRAITVDGTNEYKGRVVIDARSEKGEVINENAIAIHQVDGAIITYAFSDNPVISYTADELVVSTRSISMQYPLAYLRKLTLEGHISWVDGIDEVTVPNTEFHFSDEGTTVHGEKPGTPFYVFNTRGMQLRQGIIDANGKADIRMTNLPKGIYVIKTQSTSFKIKK